ncbi:SDR family oxidoreductase [Gymnodinialimonas ceratoperidinii]|uniref:SDR family oxidoreductase n=1 Tax=Gymnodinialimonas ceratoperidinii TaxID=2856823 RepID=A0A8F6YBN7_9RHOB|nr:SDR family oxidoreductase [Gymnodinialimonas ceratoperidinii]QXT40326.1 SDR family oxidoreductase [Gymnodinialimonas ceratoperidinii]
MTALITGAAKRLGRAMALELAAQGHDVAIHYNGSAEAAEATAEEARAFGVKAIALQADLLDEATLQGLMPRVIDALGPVEVLVNNASVFDYDNLRSATRETWDAHMMSNLRAPFVLTQALAGQLPEAETDEGGEPVARGLVVNMVDQRVRKLTPEFMTYTLAKAALWTFTQTAAQALAPRCRVNAIGPGPTMQGARQSDAHFAAQRAATVLERGAGPEDVVHALRYFLGAKTVTGQLICTDGGQHLGWKTPDVVGVE